MTASRRVGRKLRGKGQGATVPSSKQEPEWTNPPTATRKAVSIKWHCHTLPNCLICRRLHLPAQQGLHGQVAWACRVGRWQARTESCFVRLDCAVGQERAEE